jgi:hypothetical protein
MPSNECIPFLLPGDIRTVNASAAITGKRFVKIIAARIGGGANGLSTDVENLPQAGPCTASGEAALGVAQYDAGVGSNVGVFLRGSGVTVPITAGANITAGQQIQTDATGQAIPLASGIALGYAIDSASSGNDAEIHLY